MQLEDTGQWGAILEALSTSSMVEVAEGFAVNAGAIAAAIKRTGSSRSPIIAHDERSSAPPMKSGKGASKSHLLKPYADRLGREPDAVIAKLANVSTRTVASYRARLDIAGYDRWQDPNRARTQKRRSAIDPYLEFVGVETDAEVGKRAGVSAQAVRNYRSKRGIAAAKKRRELRGGSNTASGTAAWRVEFHSGDVLTARVVTADSLDEALTRSRAAGLGDVTGIVRLGQML